MKFKTFDKMMSEIKEHLDSLDNKEKLLEKVYGSLGDNPLSSEYLFVDKMIDVALKDLKADDWVYDAVWEILGKVEPESFVIEGSYYECSLENIWMYCKGKLDERYSTGFVENKQEESRDEISRKKEATVDSVLSSIFLDIKAIHEKYLFEFDDEKTRMQLKGDIFNCLFNDYINTKKINDFKIDFDIFEGNNVMLISIQVWEGTEGYTLEVQL